MITTYRNNLMQLFLIALIMKDGKIYRITIK